MMDMGRDNATDMRQSQPATAKSYVIEEQLAVIRRGAVQVLSEDELAAKLGRGEPLTVKLGCDPSRPDLHLGHMVVLKKVREFQDLGHKAVLIIGDFTATIGDPTGRSKSRPQMTLEETKVNGETYLEQAGKVLDMSPDKVTVRYNSEWFGDMKLAEVIRLASEYTVARILERNDFHMRFLAEQPIGVHEFLYPLLQAYDSVVLGADVEIGGTDQTFNLLVGRDVQRHRGLPAQVIVTLPLLRGLDGSEKMSKSLDNYIGLSDPAELMYEKLMKVPDALLPDYFTLLTQLSTTAEQIASDPVVSHHQLAACLVSELHGARAAQIGRARYDAVAGGAVPSEVLEIIVPASLLNNGQISITALAIQAKLCSSNSDVRRLVGGRGLKLNGQIVEDPWMQVSLQDPVIIQKGKSRFVRLVPERS